MFLSDPAEPALGVPPVRRRGGGDRSHAVAAGGNRATSVYRPVSDPAPTLQNRSGNLPGPQPKETPTYPANQHVSDPHAPSTPAVTVPAPAEPLDLESTPVAPVTEAQLVATFEAVVLPHLPMLLAVAKSKTLHQQDAEDLVSDTLIRAMKGFASFDGRFPKTWLRRILENTFINTYRAKQRRPQVVNTEEFDDTLRTHKVDSLVVPSLEEHALMMATRRQVQDALNQLPTYYRDAVWCVDVDGFSYAETAEILQISIGTVMSRVHRGRQRLKVLLHDLAVEQGYLPEDSSAVKGGDQT
ncbi:MAG TPA: RNA polymerase subunit sigma [Actinobacteria bacterium]|nr:RNA polymerase subunit sigma [Actinomycetota bacterium]